MGLGIKCLVDEGVLTINELIRKMTVNPSNILGIARGTLGVGKAADVVIFDIDKEWTVDITKLHSKGKNSPYDGWTLKGKP